MFHWSIFLLCFLSIVLTGSPVDTSTPTGSPPDTSTWVVVWTTLAVFVRWTSSSSSTVNCFFIIVSKSSMFRRSSVTQHRYEDSSPYPLISPLINILSISRPHDSQVMVVETWKEGLRLLLRVPEKKIETRRIKKDEDHRKTGVTLNLWWSQKPMKG